MPGEQFRYGLRVGALETHMHPHGMLPSAIGGDGRYEERLEVSEDLAAPLTVLALSEQECADGPHRFKSLFLPQRS